METILEKIIELAEKIWLRLDIILDLGNMEALEFLEPLLANIFSDPLLLGFILAATAIVLYSINRIRKAHSDKEKRLDALLQELDETEDSAEVDLYKPLFPSNTLSEFEEKDPDDEIYGDEFESPASGEKIAVPEEVDQVPQEKLGKSLSWESNFEEWNEFYDYSSELSHNTDSLTTTAPKSVDKTTSSEELDQAPQELINDDFNWDSTLEEWDELYDNVSEGLQKTDEPNTISSQGKTSSDKSGLEKEELEEVDEFLEAISELGEDVEEIGEEVEKLQEKEELEENLEEVDEFLEAVAELGKNPDEPVQEEEESEEVANFLEAISELEKEPAVPERIELSLNDIEVKPELESDLITDAITPEPPQPEPVVTKSSAGPLLKSMLNSSVSAKTDALVSRLKTFQAELETRFHTLQTEPKTTGKAPAIESLRKKQIDYRPASVSYKSKQKSRSNKEYLNQLESFIFMSKQKN